MKKQIKTICGDPGGARALAEVVKKLALDPNFNASHFCYKEGIDVFEKNQIVNSNIAAGTTVPTIYKLLQENNCDILITSTSYNEYNWEKYFITAAKNLRIPSLAILDFWSNYALRFGDNEGNLVHIPDYIAVMDDEAKKELVSLGFCKENIIITGQPTFDSIANSLLTFSDLKKSRIRQGFNVQKNDFFVLFLSQPLLKVFGGPGSPNYMGFDEIFVLSKVIESLEKINQEKNIVLVICPHPREDKNHFKQYVSEKIRIHIAGEDDIRELMLSSDLVVGMNTALLVEACYLSCIALSIQPNLKSNDTVPTNKMGMSKAIYQTEDVLPTIKELLFNHSSRQLIYDKLKQFKIKKNATEMIIKLIYDILDNKTSIL